LLKGLRGAMSCNLKFIDNITNPKKKWLTQEPKGKSLEHTWILGRNLKNDATCDL
jgi:hypothetical protein